MDKWLEDEIEAAKKRKERKEFKQSRRELDAKVIETEKGKFWSALLTLLDSTIEEFNNAGITDEPVTISVQGARVWIRTPGYPLAQLFLEYRDGINDVLIKLNRQDTSRSQMSGLLDGTLDFDVSDDGHLMLRDNGTLMDVPQAVEYLMRLVLPFVHSGR